MPDGWMMWGGYAAAASVLAAGWRYILMLYSWVSSAVIVTATVHDGAAWAVMTYCLSEMKQSKFGPRSFQAWRVYVRPRQRVQSVAVEKLGHGQMLFWKGWVPLLMRRVSESGSNMDQSGIMSRPVQVTFLRGTLSVESLIDESVEFLNEVRHGANQGRYFVRRISGTAGKNIQIQAGEVSAPSGRRVDDDDAESLIGSRLLRWERGDIGPPRKISGRAIEDLSLSEEAAGLAQRIYHWNKSREWFLERGLPWKYGALLYGPPGTGKTAFVRAIAEDLNLPVFSFDLATMHNDELSSAWQRMREDTPAVALLEDIDGVFNGRSPAHDGVKLTFDALLNCLDGVERADGLLLFVTTNHVKTLDPALGGETESRGVVTRPGRIDCSVHFGGLDSCGRKLIADRILGDWPEVADELVESFGGVTGAQFERACIDRAVELYWGSVASREGELSGISG